ncbi:DUF461 domain-containing protein [Kitasatospora sp. NPDC048540]|uniref:hypothetical protein n=1 Tax=unclassified Kitasatospora TaxID=2633591 RepID=UPI00053A8D7F|nr:hypothetical protein [Kitasatospora sp. MBT63]
MSRSLRRGAIAALVLAAIVPLSACAAGNTPDTLEIKPDNAATSLGDYLRLNNIVVVTLPRAAAEGAGAGPANVTANISNSGTTPETLKSITVGDNMTATFTDAKGAQLSEIVIPAGGAVLLGGPDQPSAHVASVKVSVGGFAPTGFVFGRAGQVGTEAAVLPAVGQYAAFGPKAEAGPSASPSSSASPSAAASASPSPSATITGTPSGSPSGSAPATGAAVPSGSASGSPLAGH